jgi:hypothetical protein
LRCFSGAVTALLLPLRIVSSLLRANRLPSRIKRQAVAAQIKRPQAYRTSCLKTTSPGQSAPRPYSCPILPRLYSRKREISWLIIAGGILWSIKSWCSACGIQCMLCQIGISGLLVRKTRSRIIIKDRASARSCRIVLTSLSPSHSSSASITRI